MKAAYLLIDSTNILAVFDNGGKDKDVLGSGFTGSREGARGGKISRVGSAGRSGVFETVVGIGAEVDNSSKWVLLASFDRASDPSSCLSPDSVNS